MYTAICYILRLRLFVCLFLFNWNVEDIIISSKLWTDLFYMYSRTWAHGIICFFPLCIYILSKTCRKCWSKLKLNGWPNIVSVINESEQVWGSSKGMTHIICSLRGLHLAVLYSASPSIHPSWSSLSRVTLSAVLFCTTCSLHLVLTNALLENNRKSYK